MVSTHQRPLLAPEQHVVVDPDPDRARALGRAALAYYLRLSNYLANFRRLGFSDADFADGGSDRLVDALVAHGSADAVAARLREHLAAGADHVAVNLVPHEGEDPVAAVGALVRTALGDRAGDAIIEACRVVTAGNPFYLRELLLALQEEQEEFQRFLEREQRSHQVRAETLGELAAILAPKAYNVPSRDGSPLLSAARAVGEALGVPRSH